MSRGFVQGRFADLPEMPRIPHAWGTAEDRFVDVDAGALCTIRTRYRQFGRDAAPPMLLVHGLMTTGYSWRYVVEDLASDYRVVVPDLPGHGRSTLADGRYDPDSLVTWWLALVDALGLRGGPAIGNSLAGYLGMRAVLRDPACCTHYVCIHPPIFPSARFHALRTVLRVPGGMALLAALPARDPLRWAHKNVHYFDESLKSLEEAREYGAPLATAEGRRAFACVMRDALDPRAFAAFVDELAQRRDGGATCPVPTQLIYARQDPMVPPSTAERLHALVPDAELVWLDDSSHFAHVDTPGAVLDAVRRFVAS